MGVGGESSFHVLAVDDNVIDRKVIERLLRVSSFQVTTVDSGIKALEFLGLRNPLKSSVSPSDHQKVEVDLIITDYCMPGMTGYDLLKKIKESSSLRNIPVVIMSSENVPSRISRCLEGGAEEFLLKPVKLSDLNRLKLHVMKAKMKGKAPEQSRESETQSQCREKHDEEEEEKDSKTNKRKAMEEGISSESETKSQCREKNDDEEEERDSKTNKRKAMEEGISSDRTISKYNHCCAVI